MALAKIRGIECLAYTLEAGVVDVEAPWHGCYHNGGKPFHSMAKTLIRHAVKADFESLLEIDEASFPCGVAYDAVELSYFMNRNGAETLVLEDEGKIVAFLIMEVHRTRRRATVITIDVSESHRRFGYGSRLLARSEAMLNDYGVEVYDLQVDVTNRGAIEFYRKHGFTTVRKLPNYYANGHDAYLMVKELLTDADK
jgi:ribosomal-protein-alanine N-acetyltransferase